MSNDAMARIQLLGIPPEDQFGGIPRHEVRYNNDTVTHKSTVARTVMCRQDGRGGFPVLLDDHSKCRTNSQRKSQLS